MDCHTEDIKNEGGKLLFINLCVRSSTCTTRRSGTSNMVWFITLLLRAQLLDELYTSTCLARTVKPCIKSERVCNTYDQLKNIKHG